MVMGHRFTGNDPGNYGVGTLIPRRHHVANLQAFSAQFSLRRVDPDRDLALLHPWMNDPEARFWRMAWPPEQIATYLHGQDRSAHSTPYLGELDGVPMSYWELYRADLDPLAEHYSAREHDAGLHLLLGSAESRGRGLAVNLLSAASSWQLDVDPRHSSGRGARCPKHPSDSGVRTRRVPAHRRSRPAEQTGRPHGPRSLAPASEVRGQRAAPTINAK
jgi:GNAT superfamily N-acetyltransferase